MRRGETSETNVDNVEEEKKVNVSSLRVEATIREALSADKLVAVETTIPLRAETIAMTITADHAVNQSVVKEEVLDDVHLRQEEIQVRVLTEAIEIDDTARRSSHQIDG